MPWHFWVKIYFQCSILYTSKLSILSEARIFSDVSSSHYFSGRCWRICSTKRKKQTKEKEDLGCREQEVYVERDKGISSMMSESTPRRTILQLLLRTASLDWSRTPKNCRCRVSSKGKKVTDRSSDKNDHVKLALKHFSIKEYCKM